jgi:hypothetical protein
MHNKIYHFSHFFHFAILGSELRTSHIIFFIFHGIQPRASRQALYQGATSTTFIILAMLRPTLSSIEHIDIAVQLSAPSPL